MTPAASLLQPDSNPALYLSSVLTLYVDLPDPFAHERFGSMPCPPLLR
jgi:hypothetical protein